MLEVTVLTRQLFLVKKPPRPLPEGAEAQGQRVGIQDGARRGDAAAGTSGGAEPCAQLSDDVASINWEGYARDVAGVVGRQEQQGITEVN